MLIKEGKIHFEDKDNKIVASLISCGVMIDADFYDKDGKIRLMMDYGKRAYRVETPMCTDIVCFLLLEALSDKIKQK